jgi:hypothetical protein
MFEGQENRIHSDQHQSTADDSRRDSLLLYEHLRVSREDGDDDEYSMRSPPEPWVTTSPQRAQNTYPCLTASPPRFTNSETVHDAARRTDNDQSAKELTNSCMEQSPATHYDDSNEIVAVQIHNEDTQMHQDLLEIVDDVYDSQQSVNTSNSQQPGNTSNSQQSVNMSNPQQSVNMSKTEPISCSACGAIPSVEYEVSLNASRLWSEVNSRQDTLEAINEIRVLADCYFAARSYADAFDLYYLIWTASDVQGREYMLAAAFNCARSSATPPQDACVEVILHQALRSYLFSYPPDPLRESMLHSFLGDLYEKLKIKTNAEVHLRKAMLHLDENELSNLDKSFPDYHHITIALERQIANRQRYVSQAIGYNASIVSTDRISKRFVAEIQHSSFLESLLAWCAVIVHENARGLDAFRSVLPKHPPTQRGFICRTLLCFLIERWLSERQRSGSAKGTITLKVLAGFERLVSPPEALSAIAMLIAHDCPDQNRPPPPPGRQPSPGTLSSSLLKSIKELIKVKWNRRSFSEVYLLLMAGPGEVWSQQFDHKPCAMLYLFMMNVAPTSLVNRHLPARGVGSHNSLVPSPDLFREYEIRPASSSCLLYSPRSSFSSGLNSIRETATEAMMRSVLSFTKHPRETSSSILPNEEIMDHGVDIIHQGPQDEEMVDV